MKITDKIYRQSPYFFKVIFLNLVGYLNKRKRYGHEYSEYLKEYKFLWTSELHTIENFRAEQLKILLLESLNYSDWYRSIKEKNGISDTMVKKDPFEILNKMPILSKSDRKENTLSIENKSRKTTSSGYSSGTSGSPTLNFMDEESTERSFALWKRFHWSIGIKENDRHIRLSGRILIDPKKRKPPFWIYNRAENQLLMSVYHMTDSNLKHYVSKIENFKPVYLDGYPSALNILAQYITDNNIKINHKVKAIAVTAETLYDHQRRTIEKAFNCHVYNQYASSEGSPFITECQEGNLHINIDSGIFEIMNEHGEEVKPGEIGKLVVTSFRNFKTPLIRYDIGDKVLKSNSNIPCRCGCKMPMVESILGREDDVLWTFEKGYVGRMGTAYKGLKGVVKSQIIQQDPKSITVNMIVGTDFNRDTENEFKKNLKDRLGDKIQIQVNFVDEIPLGPNGKFVAVKRNFQLDKRLLDKGKQ